MKKRKTPTSQVVPLMAATDRAIRQPAPASISFPLPCAIPRFPRCLLVPEHQEVSWSQVCEGFLDTLVRGREWVSSYLSPRYSPSDGFFRREPDDLTLELAESYILILTVLGVLDETPHLIPGFSVDDVCQWLRTNILLPKVASQTDAVDLAHAVSILSMLGQIHRLQDDDAIAQIGQRLIEPDPHREGEAFTRLAAVSMLSTSDLELDPESLLSLHGTAWRAVPRSPARLRHPMTMYKAFQSLAARRIVAWLVGDRDPVEQDLALANAILRAAGIRVTRPMSSRAFATFQEGYACAFNHFAREKRGARPFTERKVRSLANFPATFLQEEGASALYPYVAALSVLGADGALGTLHCAFSSVWDDPVRSPFPRLRTRRDLPYDFYWSARMLPYILQHVPLLDLKSRWLLRYSDSVEAKVTSNAADAVQLLPGGCEWKFCDASGETRLALRTTGTHASWVLPSEHERLALTPVGEPEPSVKHVLLDGEGAVPTRALYRGESFELRTTRCGVQHLPGRRELRTAINSRLNEMTRESHGLVRLTKTVLREEFEQTLPEEIATAVADDLFVPRFERWIEQFAPADRPLFLKLYESLRYLSTREVRSALSDALAQVPVHSARGAFYCGLGSHLGKSGTHLLYPLKHSVRERFPDLESAQLARSFQPLLSTQLPPAGGAARPSWLRAVIFVDDFFGSGQQATDSLTQLADRYHWLRDVPWCYIAVAGQSDGLDRIVNAFPNLSERVFTGTPLLTRKERAFAWPSAIFTRREDLKRCRALCERIGLELLRNSVVGSARRARHALGWENSQALIAFEHNTPNNTLPIIWANGNVDGRPWFPLCPRRE